MSLEKQRPVPEFYEAVGPPGRYGGTIIPSEETLEERTAFTPFIGREAIYWESPHVVHVKIVDIKFGRHIDRTPRCIFPGVRSRTQGRPFSSQTAWSLVLRPPFVRPIP